MELFDLYTRDREPTGKTAPRGTPLPEGFYRLVVHICFFNEKGEMLIQRRQPFKSGWSGMWDVSVGGSALAGEDSRAAAERETFEEIGLRVSLDRPVLTIHFDEGFDDWFVAVRDVPIEELTLQPEEVAEVKWAAREEIAEMIREGRFIPYREELIGWLFSLCNHRGSYTVS
ncbi:MAG: NUDIX domain-containing protein [Bacteroides sp.]|nr:NUDIX domain-containing protein [Eubacterium sp.]MCM1417906.1 NUDIX domain-containing protein [Roseburia sp.]MCM1461931.1 NUDIX domain-containing protein [Bacteroides sp.]